MAFVVAIDGPAGSGKGTITKAVGKRMNLTNIDTGAMYRCTALYMIRNNIGLEDTEKIKEMLETINIDMIQRDEGDIFYLNGEDVSKLIREKDVSAFVSPVSHVPEIRKAMSGLQRKMGLTKDVIMEGRDIGTNVFPDADVKIYLDATPEERARRRFKQNQEKGINMTYEEVLESIIARDNNDRTSDVAPLRQAEDAVYLDSTNLTIEEVTQKVVDIINEKKGMKNGNN